MSEPRVYFIGAGPGAADLLTLRTLRILARADVVLHDALVDPTVLQFAERAVLIAVGKRAQTASTAQRFINKALVDHARKASCVVRLKGGDPSIFGRLDEEMQALRTAAIEFEVVPGITAASAAAAQLQASLTLRGVARAVTFLTPCVCDEHDDATWVPAIDSLKAGGSLAVYMAGRHIAATATRLIEGGARSATPIAVLESVSLANSQHWLGTLATAAVAPPEIGDGPVMLLIGEALRGALQRSEPSDVAIGPDTPIARAA
jgi:uroporphyrin-III C-methyltransferase